MADWVTVEEAQRILAERGITVRYRGAQKPPSQEAIKRWCQDGILKHTQRKGGPHRGLWLIDAQELATFAPPKGGRPLEDTPSALALAQRQSRARRHASTGSQSISVTGDRIGSDAHVGKAAPGGHAPALLDLRGVPCPSCGRRGLHHPKKPQSRQVDPDRVRCRFCGRIALASELAAAVATYHGLHTAEGALAAEQAGHDDHA